METNNIGNENPSNNDNPLADVESITDAVALKEIIARERAAKADIDAKNRQLFERAKTAEGFEKQEDGSWVRIERQRPEKKSKAEAKTGELDYGQLAFHNSKTGAVKVEDQADIDFLREAMEDTGKDQQSVLTSKWFVAELKERQEKRAIESAMPKGTRGVTENASSKVDYWIQKGELPPNTPENQQLRRDVVNARQKLDTQSRKYASQSVIG